MKITKENLLTGDRVKLRNGKEYIVLKDTFMGDMLCSLEGYKSISLSTYGSDLKVKRDPYNEPEGKPFDIIKWERPCVPNMVLSPKSPVINCWTEEGGAA